MRILKRKYTERISELEVRTEENSNNTTEEYKGIKNYEKELIYIENLLRNFKCV